SLLYPYKIIALDSTRASTVIKTNDFKNITMGRAAVYVVKGFEMTPVKLSINEMNLITQEHNLKFLNESRELYAYIENHEIEMTAVKAEVIEDNVMMRMVYSENIEIKNFVVSDTVSDEETVFEVKNSIPREVEVETPMGTLVDSVSRKKFKLITIGYGPLTLQPNLSYLKELGFGDRLVINYQRENIKMWFYKRKDTGLGFKVTRPRIRRQ